VREWFPCRGRDTGPGAQERGGVARAEDVDEGGDGLQARELGPPDDVRRRCGVDRSPDGGDSRKLRSRSLGVVRASAGIKNGAY
jgi:hypothetical protein